MEESKIDMDKCCCKEDLECGKLARKPKMS